MLEDFVGKRVFDRVEINGRDGMDDFSPAEASRYAAAVNRVLRLQDWLAACEGAIGRSAARIDDDKFGRATAPTSGAS